MSQYLIQTGLALGMSSTSGYHSQEINRPPADFDNMQEVTHSDFVPSRERRIKYRGKHHDIEGAPIIIGAWPLGDTATFGWKPEEEPAAQKGWLTCVEHGVNQIDTAPVYGSGESERILGRYFADMERNGYKREDYVFQTKYSGLPLLPKNILNWSDAPMVYIKESLERTRLSFADSYLVHGPIHEQSIDTVTASIAEIVDQGLAKVVGIANCSLDDIKAYKASFEAHGIPLAFVQNEYSILRRLSEVEGIIRFCKENDIVFQGYSALATGRLTGKWDAEHEPPASYRFSKYPMKDLEPTLEVLRRIASDRQKPISAVSLNYNLIHGVVPLVSIRNPEQAQNNCEALGWRLTDEEIAAIDKVSIVGRSTVTWQRG